MSYAKIKMEYPKKRENPERAQFEKNYGSQKFDIEALQNRVNELERQIDDSDDDFAARASMQQCTACEHILNETLANHPALMELRDKFEKFHFKLIASRNENMLLKRELNMAKKVLCQELGVEAVDFQHFLNHATEEGWKGRHEKLILLQQKYHSLENKLKSLEGRVVEPKCSPSEEEARRHIPEDRKTFWRVELEKRRGYQIGDKERCDLMQENLDLRRKLEQNKVRMQEMVGEIRMLRGEVCAYSDKTLGDTIMINSFQQTENQLKDVLEERANLRRQLIAERHRNSNLSEKNEILKEQLNAYKDRTMDDREMIENLSCQNRRLQTMLEKEQTMGHQAAERFKEELKRMALNHSSHSNMIERMRTTLMNREETTKRIEEKLAEVTQYLRGKEPEVKTETIGEERRESEEADVEDKEEEDQALGENNETSEELPPEGDTGTTAPEAKSSEIQELDIIKYKTLYEAAKKEGENMTQMIYALSKSMDEMNENLLKSHKRFLQCEQERKDLEEKVKRLEKAMKMKKKKLKPWEKGKVIIPPVPPRTKVDELAMQLEVLSEENNFLRSFLSTAIACKEDDFHLYKLVSENTEKYFETSLDAIKSELAARNPPEEEVEDEEEPDEEED